MIQFYAPDIETEPFLPEEESAHCCRVLRMKENDMIVITDGKGHRFKAKITKADSHRSGIEIVEKEYCGTGRDYRIVLAIAPTKNSDRIEWFAEKATEMGVDKIILLGCDRSERKIQKTGRIEKILVSAMKQSMKTVKPELTGIIPFKDVILSDFNGLKAIGYCDERHEKKLFTSAYEPGSNVLLLIGPEGDFSPEEVDMAEKNGAVAVTFGESRLRTETAGLYGLAAIHVINGE